MIKYNWDELYNSKGNTLYRNNTIIPGGTQLLSKRPELFVPDLWPAYFSEAKGIEIADLEGRRFKDFSIMGVGAAILGYQNDYVDSAVVECIKKGVQTSLNSYTEKLLAEKLLEHHPWFDMVRYARSGGEAMTMAVRLSRACTGRDIVLFNGYHGWFDWYLAANIDNPSNLNQHLMGGLEPIGVDQNLKGTSIGFLNSEIENLESLHDLNKVAAIVIEPARGYELDKDNLSNLRNLCDKYGCVLIYDEITSGFRETIGGYHKKFKVRPDIAVFAKSMANGYAMSCVMGIKEVMKTAEKSFISSTNWTESIGPTACLATIKVLEDNEAHELIVDNGRKIKNIWRKLFNEKYGFNVQIYGIDSLPAFKLTQENSKAIETIVSAELLKHGILGFQQFKSSSAHTQMDMSYYEASLDEVLFNLTGNEIISNYPYRIKFNSFERLTK